MDPLENFFKQNKNVTHCSVDMMMDKNLHCLLHECQQCQYLCYTKQRFCLWLYIHYKQHPKTISSTIPGKLMNTSAKELLMTSKSEYKSVFREKVAILSMLSKFCFCQSNLVFFSLHFMFNIFTVQRLCIK